MGICDVCKQREATVTHTRIVNNEAEVRHLCEVCAREAGLTGGYGLFDFRSGWPDIDSLFNSFFGGAQPAREAPKADIFGSLSEAGTRVLERAKAEALHFNHDYLGTEHLLLGILNTPNLGRELLEDVGVDVKELANRVTTSLQVGPEKTIERLSVTPSAKRALEIAFEISRSLGNRYVGPEHILLGIIAEGEGLAARVLASANVTVDKVENALSRLAGAGVRAGDTGQSATPTLDEFSRDLTKLAREGKLDPVIGREKEIERMIRILSRRTKNNPVLVGEPGVGKTAIVEGLAQKIVAGEVPEVLADRRVVQLDIGAIVAGTKYRGEFEERLKKIIDEIKANSDKLIVFVDEIHALVGAGGAEGAVDASTMLKPALARGELHVIGATTLDEYRKYVEKDPALERRFQPILVDEPTVEETITILRGLRDRYEAHHRVKILDEAIVAAASLSDKYISDRFLPDKAIDLLDEAASKVRMETKQAPVDLKAYGEEIENLKKEQEAAVRSQEFEKAAELRDRIKEKEQEFEELKKKWQADQEHRFGVVTAEHIAEVVSEWTGIPVKKLVEEEIKKYLRMEEIIHEKLVGQEEAVRSIAEAVRRAMAGFKDPNRPIGSFLFLGPTGVGKTYLARLLADFLFGDEDALVRIDMSEYMEKHAVSRLIGSPPGYVGYEEGGQLTEAVRRKPYSVILFDEIEKAHPEVFNILLQLLDEGRLTDAKGRTVDFKNTLVIMTSNIGSHLIQEYAKQESADPKAYEKMKERVMDLVRQAFRPELLNRIDEIVVFHALSAEQVKQIVALMMEKVRRKVRGQGMELEVTEAALEELAKEGFDPEFGARPLQRTIQRRIENELSSLILKGEFKEGDTVVIDFRDGRFVFEKKRKKGRKKA
jgi:ATP-dependent Clp protease ATP-binding subunit ClpC